MGAAELRTVSGGKPRRNYYYVTSARKSLINVNSPNFIHSEIDRALPKHQQRSDFVSFRTPRPTPLRGFT
jgi:hypothetical protein